ncbi:hypothetical protein RQP46_002331 [Phenoliferia psychrophenolica]
MVRFKNRYLLVSFVFPLSLDNPLASSPSSAPPPAPPSISEGGLVHLLRDSLNVNFGDVGAGEVGGAFSIKYLSPTTHLLILRVSREHLPTLWAALTLLRRLGGQEVIARVLHVSGTIRKIQHAAIGHDRAAILATAKRRKVAPAAAAAGGSAGGADGDKEKEESEKLEEKLKESEEVIMALEA